MLKPYLFLIVALPAMAMAQNLLRVSGQKIIDPSTGSEFIMRGVNLGGWLVTENWMCGIKDDSDPGGRSALQTLEKRFSPAEVKELVDVWQDHWITTDDLDKIKSMGFSFVRVPFWWRNLQDKDRNWIKGSDGKVDFTRMDWIVQEAAKRQLRVLFDYHIWLDQHIKYDGISGVDSVVNHSAEVWKVVAAHFKNNATVLGYDLLNEPTGSWNAYVMDAMYQAVRSVDPDHIISIEWTDADTARWKNVLYQDHFYNLDGPTLEDNIAKFNKDFQPIIDKHKTLNVPFYVGEFQASQISDSALSWLLNNFCDQGVSWSGWTYKTNNMWGWGMISVYPDLTQVNIETDSFAEIRTRWARTSESANWYELANVRDGWTKGAKCGIPDPVSILNERRVPSHTTYPALNAGRFDLVGRRLW